MLLALVVGPSLALGQPARSPGQGPRRAPSASASAAAPSAADEARAEARQRFERGLALFEQDAYDAALAEFLRSRELYPTRAATINAARVLQRLRRHDEALDLLERLMADPASAKMDERDGVLRQIAELRLLVASIDVHTPEIGASVIVDGNPRGVTPLPPVRVNVGSHLVRVVKEGFSPFEKRLDLAGDTVNRVDVELPPLARGGRARVLETTGQNVEVVVDGVPVGQTPWEGQLSVGHHVVLLRAPGEMGSMPTPLEVTENETTALNLTLARLACAVVVEPTPVNARVAIDGVDVERGVWQGRLTCGTHRFEVASEGFFAASRSETLVEGRPARLALTLDRDLSSPLWRQGNPPRLFVGVQASGGLPTVLGGDVAGCSDCDRAPGGSGGGRIELGYRLGSGLGFAVAAGYERARQAVHGRPQALRPQGLDPQDGLAHDRLTLAGLQLAAVVSYERGQTWTLGGRLGVGVWLADLVDRRSLDVPAHGQAPSVDYHVPSIDGRDHARMLLLEPLVQAGRHLGPRWHVSVGLGAQLLAPLQTASWPSRPVLAGRCPAPDLSVCAGLATYAPTSQLGSVLLLPELQLGARAEFLPASILAILAGWIVHAAGGSSPRRREDAAAAASALRGARGRAGHQPRRHRRPRASTRPPARRRPPGSSRARPPSGCDRVRAGRCWPRC